MTGLLAILCKVSKASLCIGTFKAMQLEMDVSEKLDAPCVIMGVERDQGRNQQETV